MCDVRGDTNSINRHSDQTLCLVVYEDGEVGLAVDHAPADFGALIQLAAILGMALRIDGFPKCTDIPSPQVLRLKYPQTPLPELPPKYEELFKRSISIFELSSPPNQSARPSDALLNITFQTALLAARSGFMQPIRQPVHLRDFVDGRTDAVFPITEESTTLVRRLLSLGAIPTDASELKELARLLGEANEKRRKLIRSGKVPEMFMHGFLLCATRSALTDETVPEDFKRSVQTVLDAWSKTKGANALPCSPTDAAIVPVTDEFSTIQFTGLTITERDSTLGEYPLEGDVLAGLGNLYLPDQLALLYIVRPDRSVAVSLSAGGDFQKDLEDIQTQMEVWYPRVIKL